MIEVTATRVFHGPNIWANQPVLEAQVDFGRWAGISTREITGFASFFENWLTTLPPRPQRRADVPGFLRRLANGMSLPEFLAALALELGRISGADLQFSAFARIGPSAAYHITIEVEEELLARASLQTAVDLVLAVLCRQPIDLARKAKELRLIVEDLCVGPSTRAVVRAANARGIPVRRLTRGSLLLLGQGVRQQRVQAGESGVTSAIAETIAQDKQLTKQLVRAAGVPVPEGRLVSDPADAWAAACQIGVPVVMKPLNGNHGRGVFIDLMTREQMAGVFDFVLEEGDGVLVERCAPGSEHRLLIVGDRVVAAARGEPAVAIGDGCRTIAQLIEEMNRDPRRGEDDDCPLAPLEFDRTTRALLTKQGYTPDSTPAAGAKVLLQRNGNVSMDVTDDVHPQVARAAVRAARAVGLDIAGLDIVARDIGRPLEEQGAAVVEVNAGPGLLMHLWPEVGKPRPVGEAIVGHLFPPGENGRIPILALLANATSCTTARLLAKFLRQRFPEVGLACREGVFVNDQRLSATPGIVPDPTRQLLVNPFVAAAVYEIDPADVLADGLPFDRCRVAAIDLTGEGASADARSLAARVLLRTLEPGGWILVATDDERGLALAGESAQERILLSPDAASPVLRQHVAQGGRAVCPEAGGMVRLHGNATRQRAPLAITGLSGAPRPSSLLRSDLFAAAVAWAVDLPPAVPTVPIS